MIVAADSWPEFAGEVWAEPTTRWLVYVFLFVVFALAVWRVTRRIRAGLAELREDVGIVKREVKNDHHTNLREEADDRHDQNYRALGRIEAKVDQLAVAVGVHQYRLDDIDNDLGRTRDRRPEQ